MHVLKGAIRIVTVLGMVTVFSGVAMLLMVLAPRKQTANDLY